MKIWCGSNRVLEVLYLYAIWDQFEEFFGRKVDLLTRASIKNPILKNNIDTNKILIYDGKEQKVSF